MSSVALVEVWTDEAPFLDNEAESLEVKVAVTGNAVLYDWDFAPTLAVALCIIHLGSLSKAAGADLKLRVKLQWSQQKFISFFDVGSRE